MNPVPGPATPSRADRTAPDGTPRSPQAPNLLARLTEVRATTLDLAAPLSPEDCQVQTAAFVSPPKWHLAHTTWFFETFLLKEFLPGWRPFHPRFHELFNSYYLTQGSPHPRPRRGILSRPSLEEILRYRAAVDRGIGDLLAALPAGQEGEIISRLELGLHHEQQHQELLLMDAKHILGTQPLRPAYRKDLPPPESGDPGPLRWVEFPGGVVEIGAPETGFAFDNERPRHRVLLPPYRLALRLVTCGEYREFMDAGGYQRPELWLSDGWDAVVREGWRAPLYWEREGRDGLYTLGGVRPLRDEEPVGHLSLFEADAYARFRGARLPTEAEWEAACGKLPVEGNTLESGLLHPAPAPRKEGLLQAFGDLWEWTQSAYGPYPGFRPLSGSLGEYNGKFMNAQTVLRGGSFATPASHLRASYRNFFHAEERWMFSGIRLAMDSKG